MDHNRIQTLIKFVVVVPEYLIWDAVDRIHCIDCTNLLSSSLGIGWWRSW